MTRRAFGIVALAGVAAGCLDLLYAFVYFGLSGITPIRILQATHKGGSSPPLTVINGVLVHMFGVGVPIALGARRAGRAATRIDR